MNLADDYRRQFAWRTWSKVFAELPPMTGQTVLDRWGGRNDLWHRMLAQKGFIIVSVDNRGTPSPRGRAWRKSIYRQIGILASKDQAEALVSAAQEINLSGLATKEYVGEKINQQTWQLVFFMAAQAALIVALIKLFQ